MKHKIYRDKKGQWRFVFISRNGRKVAWGEAYTRKRNAEKAIECLRKYFVEWSK